MIENGVSRPMTEDEQNQLKAFEQAMETRMGNMGGSPFGSASPTPFGSAPFSPPAPPSPPLNPFGAGFEPFPCFCESCRNQTATPH